MTRPQHFSRRLIAWQEAHGRHDLPWARTRDPYRVWLSEIMLQQTRVATVIPYYHRFLARFPNLQALAAAPVEEVMALWSGLGYYARARNLKRCADEIMRQHDGRFPAEADELARLPGIGRSTANAIAVFCYGARLPILDANVRRVLDRCFGSDGAARDAPALQRLWHLAAMLVPSRDVEIYTQAQMDLGATVCTPARPACQKDAACCPLSEMCVARKSGRLAAAAKAAKKALPSREIVVLLLRDHGGRLLLLERPPAGIWGSLQSLPELEGGIEPGALAASLGCRAGGFVALAPVRHRLTHLELVLRPLLAEVRPLSGAADGAGKRWLDAGQIAAAPLPSPIRKIILAAPRPAQQP